QNGQGNPRKASPRAHIQDLGALVEGLYLGNPQGMEHMAKVEFIDILTGYQVDLAVPVPVQPLQGPEPLLLGFIKRPKIFENEFGAHKPRIIFVKLILLITLTAFNWTMLIGKSPIWLPLYQLYQF